MNMLFCIETENFGIIRQHYFNSLSAVRHFIKTGGRGKDGEPSAGPRGTTENSLPLTLSPTATA